MVRSAKSIIHKLVIEDQKGTQLLERGWEWTIDPPRAGPRECNAKIYGVEDEEICAKSEFISNVQLRK